MKTRAAVLFKTGLTPPYGVSRPLRVMDVELDPPGRGEVLVRVRAAGLCHSDLSVLDGTRSRQLPMILGHECAGEVEKLGPAVTDLRVGDHVVASFVPSCGACEPCIGGRPALCEPGFAANMAGTLLSGARRLHAEGGEIHHYLGVSAFAEHAVLARNSLIRVDPRLPFDEAAIFGCAVVTGTGAVVNTAGVPRGSTVAIVGLGGVGLAALLAAHMLDAKIIVAIDLSEEKLKVANILGATHTFNAGDPDCAKKVREATHGGLHFAFEMAGSVAALELAYRVTRRGGTTVTAGLSGADQRVSLSHLSLVSEERTVKGSFMGSAVPTRDIPRYIGWYQAGKLPVKRLLSEHITLDQINEGFDRLAASQSVRQIVVM
jgi:Zn-dependent alcohol dehydrogenase